MTGCRTSVFPTVVEIGAQCRTVRWAFDCRCGFVSRSGGGEAAVREDAARHEAATR